jgi:hypothetical protein
MRTLLFWLAVLPPKARLAFVVIFGFLIYAICRS